MQTFRKNERLCRKTSIDELFSKGQSFFVYPFKISWIVAPENSESPAQVLISVPKRNFKIAVKRNRIKRLIREVYRKRKIKLYNSLLEKKLEINFAIIYTSKVILSYQEMDEKIIVVIDRLIKAHEETIG
jgi:ribonuclease P protein component